MVIAIRSMKGERLGEFEEFTLLAVRALGDHTYAVPVQQFVEESTGRGASIGAIYAALGRLEKKGFVRSGMSDARAQRGGRERRVVRSNPAPRHNASEADVSSRSVRAADRARAPPGPREDLEHDCRRTTIMSKQPPPALARWLLRMQPLGARRAEIEADLEELYEVRLQDRGHRHAKWRYYRD